MKLSFSLVLFEPDIGVLKQTLLSLGRALAVAKQQRPELDMAGFVIDNHTDLGKRTEYEHLLLPLRKQGVALQILGNEVNLGYGGGHNLCLPKIEERSVLPCDCHLILNPDVILSDNFFINGLPFLEANADVVGVAPYVRCENHQALYLCKRYPSVLDLALRGFAPQSIRHFFQSRLDQYQMKDVYDAEQVNTAIPIMSGCCMLLRTEALLATEGFDERYFLYFEDFDLSLRLAKRGKLAYQPDLHIQHLGGFSSSKGWWHIREFIRSGYRFFNQYGWRWW